MENADYKSLHEYTDTDLIERIGKHGEIYNLCLINIYQKYMTQSTNIS